uniref:Uncharacterized protein n=1 Tax=Anopheles albimanus TaxID=7167 RepID=A0A182FWI7_ANOAL
MQFWGFVLMCLAAFAFFEESNFFAFGQTDVEPDDRSANTVPPKIPIFPFPLNDERLDS